ncbi:hypothetical protein GCM10020367_35850 [Streptomyces sannanensis]|uniref:DUF4232 domain-containing protein n=1 Tax=Streptomyces sannanensis TaxID=285536 RepID=A0ABP6SDZ3_9ACTN
MGSLRNPVGPLPSSIYWRRRAVALSFFALLALLTAWAVGSGGGGGDKDDAKGSGPATSITPGPSRSGTAITGAPGGRDESGSSDGGTGGDTAGTDGDDGTGTGNADNGGTGTAGSGADGTVSGAAAGQPVSPGSGLPDCTPGALRLSLRSVKNAYGPDERPTFQLVATNISGTTCKADFGPKAAVLTITEAEADDAMWSSADCPKSSDSLLLKVPAGSTIAHTVEWDRRHSAPQCATPPADTAAPGTYLVEAKTQGRPVVRASFVLEKD